MAVQMTTDTVKNAKMTTELVVDFVFFEMLTTEKSATGPCSVGCLVYCANKSDQLTAWII